MRSKCHPCPGKTVNLNILVLRSFQCRTFKASNKPYFLIYLKDDPPPQQLTLSFKEAKA